MNATESVRPIEKESIVRYLGGYHRVSAVIADTVNLRNVFGSKVNFKRVPLSEVVEAHDEWYAKWQQTEAYRCM